MGNRDKSVGFAATHPKRLSVKAVIDLVNVVLGLDVKGDESRLVLLEHVLLGAREGRDAVHVGDGLEGAVGHDLFEKKEKAGRKGRNKKWVCGSM